MSGQHQYLENPGTQFCHVLAQVYEHLNVYQRLGLDGVLSSKLSETSTQSGPTAPTLETIRATLHDCQRCKLHISRRHVVVGAGNPRADLVFVGEAPGAQEDRQGHPFVGKAGDLLTRIIAAIELTRAEVYITNIVKCRPPHNRDPEPDEVATCEPFLEQQLTCIQPKVICALGRWAAQTLLKTSTPISKLRGRWHEYQGIPVMPTYHPAYLLRNPQDKRLVWEDVQQVQKVYNAGDDESAIPGDY
jgi:uracil-DNA glycosylase